MGDEREKTPFRLVALAEDKSFSSDIIDFALEKNTVSLCAADFPDKENLGLDGLPMWKLPT